MKKALFLDDKFLSLFGNDLAEVGEFSVVDDLQLLNKFGKHVKVVTCWHYPQKYDIGVVLKLTYPIALDYTFHLNVIYNYIRRNIIFNLHPVHNETNVVMPTSITHTHSIVRHSDVKKDYYDEFLTHYNHSYYHIYDMYDRLDTTYLDEGKFYQKLDNVLSNVSRSELGRMRDSRAVALLLKKSPFFQNSEPYSYLTLMLVTLYLFEFGKSYADANSKFYNEMYLQTKKLRSDLERYSQLVWARANG